MDNITCSEHAALVWHAMHIGEICLPRVWKIEDLILEILKLNLALTHDEISDAIDELLWLKIAKLYDGKRDKIYLNDKNFAKIIDKGDEYV